MTFNTFALSKGYILIPNNFQTADNFAEQTVINEQTMAKVNYAMNLQVVLMHYGYMLDSKAFNYVVSLGSNATGLLAELKSYLIDLFGDGDFRTLFGNYPNTVIEMSDSEMLLHTIVEYLTAHLGDAGYMPNPDDPNDAEHASSDKYNSCLRDEFQIITLKNATDLLADYAVMLKSEQSLAPKDQDAIKYLANHYHDLNLDGGTAWLISQLPVEIPFKETLCLVAQQFPTYPLQTTTDVLRLAYFMSGKDVSLSAIPKVSDTGWSKTKLTKAQRAEIAGFKKFTRSERRLLLSKLDHILAGNSALENMKKYEGRWIRLGEILHPGEYSIKYPNSYKAFYTLRNNANTIKTWNSKVEIARRTNNVQEMLRLYTQRPGEFARALDSLLRNFPKDTISVLKSFEAAADKVSMKMLYELLDHFYKRENGVKNRTVTIKGARRPVALPDLDKMDSSIVETIQQTLIKLIANKFSEKESLHGKIYILDQDLTDIGLPKNMRSANDAIHQIARGTKLPIKDSADIIRVYCHWICPDGRDDLDLHATLCDENGKTMYNVGFSSNYSIGSNGELSNSSYGDYSVNKNKAAVIFSGDVRNKSGNCAEYIDISLSRLQKAGIRYVVTTVNDYNGLQFRNAYGGYMERSTWGTPGETTWAPETVGNGIKITSHCQGVYLMIVDVVDRKIIHVDEDQNGIPVSSCHNSQTEALIERYCSGDHGLLNACSVIYMNLKARDAIVSIKPADEFATAKAQTEAKIKELKANIAEADRVIKTADSEDDLSTVLLAKDQFEAELKDYEKVNFISYDDFAFDYSKILDWMF